MITEGQWRFVKINTLKGYRTRQTLSYDSDGSLVDSFNSSKSGILYHYIGLDFSTGEFREKLVVEDLEPPWGGVDLPTDIRNAFLDLGGFTFKIGLRVRLF